MMRFLSLPACVVLWSSQIASAQVLDFPSNAALQLQRTDAPGQYALPIGPYAEGAVPIQMMEGNILQQAWRIEASGLTSLQILRPLREQLIENGFEILLECETEICGGFDFRFGTQVLPPPKMYIDLGDFRFLSAQRDQEAISLLVSRSLHAGFIQMTYIGTDATPHEIAVPQAPAAGASRPALSGGRFAGDFSQMLDAQGRVVLNDLRFSTGSSALADGEFDSLQSLADYLSVHPERRVALVGHTDSEGSLDGNIGLSRRRAASVLQRLVQSYDVNRNQLEAQGMGYLAPLASNLTAEGRDLNRRVEVIVTTTQ